MRTSFPSAVVWLNEAKASVVAGGLDAYGKPIELAMSDVSTDLATDSSLEGSDSKPRHRKAQQKRMRMLPPGLTWFSVDWYPPTPRSRTHSESEPFAAKLRRLYMTNVYPRMHDHQQAVLVPPSYASDEVQEMCDRKCFDSYFSREAAQHAKWAAEDAKIAAMIPYHLRMCPNCRGRHNEVGIRDMNETKLAWRMIGQQYATAALSEGDLEDILGISEKVHERKVARNEAEQLSKKSEMARERAVDIGGKSETVELALEAARRRNSAIEDTKERFREFVNSAKMLERTRSEMWGSPAAIRARQLSASLFIRAQQDFNCEKSKRLLDAADEYGRDDEMERALEFELDYSEPDQNSNQSVVADRDEHKVYNFCSS